MKVRCPFCATRKPREMTCPNPACPTHRGRSAAPSERPPRKVAATG